MYESPINLIYKDYQTQIKENADKLILEAVQEVGVDVDKNELIKAINYDRQQYKKGYTDGKKEVLDKIRADIECLTITEGGDDYTRKMAELFALKIKVLQIIDKHLAEVGE